MTLWGKVKQATGIGLDGPTSYQRAFEKGVLLGNYGSAAGMFRDAAEKLTRESDTALAARAAANWRLYEFLAQPNVGLLAPLRDALSQTPEIEQIGSQMEVMPTAPLVEELNVRIVESRVPQGPPSAVITGHEQAKKALEAILDRDLILYRTAPLPGEGPLVETAMSRYYWHHGLSYFNAAIAKVDADPAAAANDAAAATQAFQQAGDGENQQRADEYARNLQVRRTCWMCRRELQGLGTYINWYPSALTPYIVSVLERANQDQGSIDVSHGVVVLCTPCAAVVERRADEIAQRRVHEVRTELLQHIGQLEVAVTELQRLAHKH